MTGAGSAPRGDLSARTDAPPDPGRAPGAVPQPPAPAPCGEPLPRRPVPAARARVALLGASGYTGQEFVRLALRHPALELVALCSREHAGRSAAEAAPGLDPGAADLPPVVDSEGLEELLVAGAFDTLVACLPHGAWAELAARRPALARKPARLVDLSSDHRDGRAGFVYGLPEALRESIAAATRVANPGCYPTAALLALLPAAEAGWLGGPVTIQALSGVSGAGRAPALRTSFVELDGGASLYRPGVEHPHVAEMERALALWMGAAPPLVFLPQLVPMSRGILLTATAPLAVPVTVEEAQRRYRARYRAERFVRVLPPGRWPETRAVRMSNRCDVAVTTLHEGRTLLASAAIDNLGKGAAGQAIQNLNLMLGCPEDLGLPVEGCPW